VTAEHKTTDERQTRPLIREGAPRRMQL